MLRTSIEEAVSVRRDRASRSPVTLSGARLPQFLALPGDLGIHGVRRQVNLTRPSYHAIIDEDPLEKLLVSQGRKGARQFVGLQPHAASHPIFEPDKEAVVRFRHHFHNIPIHGSIAPFKAAAQSSPARRGRWPSITSSVPIPTVASKR
jgi:hypothetical protein